MHLERMRGIEPPSQPWQGHIRATKLHPHFFYNNVIVSLFLYCRNSFFIFYLLKNASKKKSADVIQDKSICTFLQILFPRRYPLSNMIRFNNIHRKNNIIGFKGTIAKAIPAIRLSMDRAVPKNKDSVIEISFDLS